MNWSITHIEEAICCLRFYRFKWKCEEAFVINVNSVYRQIDN